MMHANADPAPPTTTRARPRLAALILSVLAPWAALAQNAPSGCGPISNAYGPFDYRTDKDKLVIVETHHFTGEVEALIRGKEGYLGADLDYTLRAAPNHHRALLSMMRYGDRLKADIVPAANYTVECYFIRAVTYKPDDTTVRMLYATYLNARQRKDEALQQLAQARQHAGDNAFTHYNLGLVYMDIGAYAEALEQAHLALSMGFPRTELKERLIAAKKWAEPPSAPRSTP
jgi:tetratricopeptide (TPR) repeat protein